MRLGDDDGRVPDNLATLAVRTVVHRRRRGHDPRNAKYPKAKRSKSEKQVHLKNLLNLRMPRLPSALGLSGA
eukprot:scaffold6913_cov114-Isochrysis_galbana.AAC.1